MRSRHFSEFFLSCHESSLFLVLLKRPLTESLIFTRKKVRLLQMQIAQYTAELLVEEGGVCAISNYTQTVVCSYPPPPIAIIIITALSRHNEITTQTILRGPEN